MLSSSAGRQSSAQPRLSTTARVPISRESEDKSQPSISFNISKKEIYTPLNGFKSLQRRLRSNYKVGLFKEEMNLPKLIDTNLLVFGAPCEKFSTAEVSGFNPVLGVEGVS
jgi:intraflagellar transport protein 52